MLGLCTTHQVCNMVCCGVTWYFSNFLSQCADKQKIRSGAVVQVRCKTWHQWSWFIGGNTCPATNGRIWRSFFLNLEIALLLSKRNPLKTICLYIIWVVLYFIFTINDVKTGQLTSRCLCRSQPWAARSETGSTAIEKFLDFIILFILSRHSNLRFPYDVDIFASIFAQFIASLASLAIPA